MASPAAWKQMKRWPGWIVLGIVVVVLVAFGAGRDSGPQTSEERVESIAKRLACPICDGESVFESRNETSDKIRNKIRTDVAAGVLGDDQIIGSIEQVYGAKILLVPRASGIDALVWALPTAAFVCAVAGLTVAFRRWHRAADTIPSEDDRVLVEVALRGDADEP